MRSRIVAVSVRYIKKNLSLGVYLKNPMLRPCHTPRGDKAALSQSGNGDAPPDAPVVLLLLLHCPFCPRRTSGARRRHRQGKANTIIVPRPGVSQPV